MKRLLTIVYSGFFLCPLFTSAIDIKDTRMLAQPTVGKDQIAFIYAEDLWVANTDGSQPRRLTVDEGVESSPVFSPDGKVIAFSAQYDGNIDVFTIPVEGGIAIWTKDGFIVENVGVAPDIEVEQWPSEVLKGKDPQLEKAIEIALKELGKNPQTDPVRPAYPVRAKN